MRTLRIVMITAGCLVLILAGFFLEKKGFAANLLTVFLEIILTYAVIDWLLEMNRKRQWKKVRAQIVFALTCHLGNIASEYMINFRGRDFDLIAFTEDVGAGYGNAIPRAAKALMLMAKTMEKSAKPEKALEMTESVYSTIKWDIEQIRDSLLPRILAIETDEPELVALMGELDNAGRGWVNAIIVDQEISSGDQYEEAIATLRATANLYDYLASHAEKSESQHSHSERRTHMPLLNNKYQRFDQEDVKLMQKMLEKFHEMHRGTGMPDYATDYVGYLPVFAIALLASQESVDKLTKKVYWLTWVLLLENVVLLIFSLVLILKR